MSVQYKIFCVNYVSIPATDRGVHEFFNFQTVELEGVEVAVNGVMSVVAIL